MAQLPPSNAAWQRIVAEKIEPRLREMLKEAVPLTNLVNLDGPNLAYQTRPGFLRATEGIAEQNSAKAQNFPLQPDPIAETREQVAAKREFQDRGIPQVATARGNLGEFIKSLEGKDGRTAISSRIQQLDPQDRGGTEYRQGAIAVAEWLGSETTRLAPEIGDIGRGVYDDAWTVAQDLSQSGTGKSIKDLVKDLDAGLRAVDKTWEAKAGFAFQEVARLDENLRLKDSNATIRGIQETQSDNVMLTRHAGRIEQVWREAIEEERTAQHMGVGSGADLPDYPVMADSESFDQWIDQKAVEVAQQPELTQTAELPTGRHAAPQSYGIS